MSDPRLAATPRYHLIATLGTCDQSDCTCHQVRRRSEGVVHCPLCRAATPTLQLAVRGSVLQAVCATGCPPLQLQALIEGDNKPLLALYGAALAPQHAQRLLDSAIAPHVAEVRAYSTVTSGARLGRLGFARSQQLTPTLLIPTYNVHGEIGTYQARPDYPRIKDRKQLKYETVAGGNMALDIPRYVRRLLGNPRLPLFITEGARKADAAVSIGLCCIAVLGVWNWRGTNEWGGKTALPDWELIALKDAQGVGREVYLVFDSDIMQKLPVYLALRRLKAFLESRGAVVRVVYLPSGDDGSKVGLDDFLAAGHDVTNLLELATDVLRDHPEEDAEDEDDERPEVDAGHRDLKKLMSRTWSALAETNDPPTLFYFGGVVARIEASNTETTDSHQASAVPIIRPLDSDRLLVELAYRIRWVHKKETEGGILTTAALPPPHVIRGVMGTAQQPLPELLRIVEAPIFAPDGSLHTDPGYGSRTRCLYVPGPGFVLPDVPEHPTTSDILRARDLIVNELLGDFPFVSPSELAHAVALLILPFVRDLIDGPTPLHLIEKPSPGTGATLLVDMLLFPILGRPLAGMTEATDEAEWRKRLTAKFLDGGSVLLIDNLRRRLDSAAVAAAITMTVWEDRILGISKMAKLPVRCAWVATGNNPTLSHEMTRRSIPIRLDAQDDQPWLRQNFRHPDLRAWASEHHADLVWSALVLGRAWIDAGRPAGLQGLGMFEAWAAVIGGILDVAGIGGFLGNLRRFYAASDFERSAWQPFLAAWWDHFGSASVGVVDLIDIALTSEPALDLGDKGERSQRTRLGRLIGSVRDRRFRISHADGFGLVVQVTPDTAVHNAQHWRLVPVNVTNVDEPFPHPRDEGSARANAAPDAGPHARTEPSGLDDVRHVSHVHHVEAESSAVGVGSWTDTGVPDPGDWEEI